MERKELLTLHADYIAKALASEKEVKSVVVIIDWNDSKEEDQIGIWRSNSLVTSESCFSMIVRLAQFSKQLLSIANPVVPEVKDKV
jgi:hypothetical protein